MEPTIIDAVYARPSPDLIETAAAAIEFSPLVPDAQALEDQADGSVTRFTAFAPAGVLERRYVLAQALRVLAPGGELVVLAPKDKGGTRLAKELGALGCAPIETARRHHRFCHVRRPERAEGLAAAIATGAPRIVPALGAWSQPGLFSWDRRDPGTALLLRHLPPLSGAGADFGCGVGLLARAVLASPNVASLELIDIDRRAVDATRRNIDDPRARFAWRDLRGDSGLANLDFVVMNPPFHDQGHEDRALGGAFIRQAAAALKPKGVCWLVANRHLPYEAWLKPLFPRARQVVQAEGYKVYEARK